MKSIYEGSILVVRDAEDCIRATRKYTEGIGTVWKKHPIQGEGTPSRMFVKYYEVYPDVELGHMSLGTIMDWLWKDVTCIDVWFRYDYRVDRASMQIKNGPEAVKELVRAIPGFSDAVGRLAPSHDAGRGRRR